MCSELQSENFQNTRKFCFRRVFLKLQQNENDLRNWNVEKSALKLLHMN